MVDYVAMIEYPAINPVAIDLGLIKIRWYGISYVVGILLAWWLLHRRVTVRPAYGWSQEQVGDIIFYGTIGIILGGRIGWALFYNFGYVLEHPLALFRIWEGGMSFHGGLLGVFLAFWYFSRTMGRSLFELTDFIAPVVPIGLFFGRIANFINGELWGAPSSLPWAMVFPHVDQLPRHPSQLYEAGLEGILLFIILWVYARQPRPHMALTGMALSCYGLFRILVELVREPDRHIGYLAGGWLTMGQLLSWPMLIFGILFLYLAYRAGGTAGRTA